MEIRQPTSALEVHQHIVCSLQKQDPVILDIGCYDGADSLHCLRLCPEAQLYWFEPDPPGRLLA
ncbi:precorrin-6B methylase 2 [Bradyrhizobium centrosematis]|nr:precorrin-6B methylase 2 [Bradyrhizobium centrosematis]MCS3776275.1 precorrin-6B methylase 2 [Bradyrhizobium centrosematis]